MVEMYTDGAARGNPGKGGFGTVLLHPMKRLEIAKAYRHTTNNRMELLAVIEGLEALTKIGCEVCIYSDSKYVVEAVEKGWVFSWSKKPNFANKKNPDLWQRFLKLYALHKLKFVWVKGHESNQMNNYCDILATQAADSGPYLVDEVYESQNF
jgi:ribonuclease HI